MEKQKEIEKGSASYQLQKILIKMIEDGEYLPGEKLYSERAMANKYGVSRMTVQYAFNELVKKGYLYRVRGSGTFVRKSVVEKMNLNYLSERGNGGITAIARKHGAQISSKVLTEGVVRGTCFSVKLGLERDADVYVLHRVRYGNGEPIAVEYTYVPAELFPEMSEIDFEKVSLYDYMDSVSHMPINFMQKLQIIEASQKERTYLELGRKDPVYYFEFVGYDREGNIVEYTESYTRCDKFIYTFDALV
ncbi:GntR family transcriptional regulator [bacterium 210820-DFI.6.37]|nr:GntR family transcriptional regulator [bacterium 210820-DFI.6.37]